MWVEISTSNSLSSIRIGFTDQLVAALAEARLVVGYWLRSGNTHCVNGAAEFLRHTLNSLPRHVAVGRCAPTRAFRMRRCWMNWSRGTCRT